MSDKKDRLLYNAIKTPDGTVATAILEAGSEYRTLVGATNSPSVKFAKIDNRLMYNYDWEFNKNIRDFFYQI